MNLESILKQKFKHLAFRKGQKEVIEDVIAGKNVLAMLPTGAGKSLCYLLPGYVLSGAVVIVSPLLSLMEDQVRQIKMQGEKRVIALNSQLTYNQKHNALAKLNQYRFIFVSPEMLQQDKIIHALCSINVSLFVVDEAHCISQWGHDFRTDYLKLYDVISKLNTPNCLALTATATEEVQRDIIDQLQLTQVSSHIHPIDRPNIALFVDKVESYKDKVEKIISQVKNLEGPGIIYFTSRLWTEQFSQILKDQGIKRTAFYHGGMTNEERLLIQQQFMNGQVDVVCCTNAFGMGINKSNIRFVIHFHHPSQIESYLQEIGRAGRDGKPSIALLYYQESDYQIPENLIASELPDDQEIQKTIHYLLDKEMVNLDKNKDEDLCIQLQLNEVKWRFIKYHMMDFIGAEKKLTKENSILLTEQIRNKVIERTNSKIKSLFVMREWLENRKHCRRTSLLSHFKQRPENINPTCCDVCMFDMSPFQKQLKDEQHKYMGWERELELIFNVK